MGYSKNIIGLKWAGIQWCYCTDTFAFVECLEGIPYNRITGKCLHWK